MRQKQSLMFLTEAVFTLRIKWFSFRKFYNIVKPTIQNGCNLYKTFRCNGFDLSHFGKYICADTCLQAHLRLCHDFIDQQFPWPVMVLSHKMSFPVRDYNQPLNVQHSMAYSSIIMMSRF